MPMTGEDWISRHFQPLVDALPNDAPDVGTVTSQLTGTPEKQELLRGIIALRLHGAVEALETVGVLTTSQVERCKAALSTKGLAEERRVVHMTSSHFATGTVSSQGGGEADVPAAPDELTQVVAVNRILGLLDDEPCRITAVEIWQQSVHAHLLAQVGDATVDAEREQAKVMQQWIRDRNEGRAEAGSRPPLPQSALFAGHDLTWTLDVNGRSHRGHLVAGRSDRRLRRLEIAWPVQLPEGSHRLDITVTQHDTVCGRLSIDT